MNLYLWFVFFRKPIHDYKAFLREKSVVDSNGCWNWSRAIDSNGYGVIGYLGGLISTHRLSYKLFNGKIPKGKVVCHKCDNPKCVNPDHLFIGTQKDNIQDMIRKGRHVARGKGKKEKPIKIKKQ